MVGRQLPLSSLTFKTWPEARTSKLGFAIALDNYSERFRLTSSYVDLNCKREVYVSSDFVTLIRCHIPSNGAIPHLCM